MITVSTTIKNKTIAEVWDFFTNPIHVINWNFAGDDWHCPKAANHLEVGKSFTYRMEAKNGETGFDFTGIYTEIEPLSKINYVLADDRKILFSAKVCKSLDPAGTTIGLLESPLISIETFPVDTSLDLAAIMTATKARTIPEKEITPSNKSICIINSLF